MSKKGKNAIQKENIASPENKKQLNFPE